MDLETLERILREGPPDEPMYVPGAYRRAAAPRRWLMTAVGIGLALVLGVAAGLALDSVRDQRTGRALTSADLQGTWMSGEISRDDWFAGLADRGFDRAEAEAVFDSEPFERVRYGLEFTGSHLRIVSSLDGLPLDENSRGIFTVVDGERLVFIEDRVSDPGLMDPCIDATAGVELRDGRLTFADVQLPDNLCGRQTRLIFTAFLTLSEFHRSGE